MPAERTSDNRAAPRRGSFKAVARLTAGLWLIAVLATSGRCDEKDRIQLRRPGGSRIGVTGTILDYTGREIRILLNKESEPKSYDIRQVADVIYTRTPGHHDGLQAMQAGQYEEALRLLGIGMAEEQRQWVRRDILAAQLRCELRLGHRGGAGTKFLAIVESDPDTHYYHLIPLIWTPQQLTSDDLLLARQWIEQSSDAAKLLGASFLLDHSTLQSSALRVLRKLSSNPDSRIFGLARAQSWRPAIQLAKPTATDLVTWSRQVDQIPEELRAGPYYLLGRAYQQNQDYQRAAQAFLWVPLVYDDNRQLAARSCLDAANVLQADGKTGQALTLYREVATRFKDTPFASEARDHLKQHEAPPKTRSGTGS